MKKVYGPDFQLEQKVTVIELERPGIVKSIWITQQGIQYEVRYFYNGKLETVYFFKDELRVRTS